MQITVTQKEAKQIAHGLRSLPADPLWASLHNIFTIALIEAREKGEACRKHTRLHCIGCVDCDK